MYEVKLASTTTGGATKKINGGHLLLRGRTGGDRHQAGPRIPPSHSLPPHPPLSLLPPFAQIQAPRRLCPLRPPPRIPPLPLLLHLALPPPTASLLPQPPPLTPPPTLLPPSIHDLSWPLSQSHLRYLHSQISLSRLLFFSLHYSIVTFSLALFWSTALASSLPFFHIVLLFLWRFPVSTPTVR